ncbi:MAG: SMP-30/gluconolactonase/LRE family protein [Rhodoglobus sp.]|nr:SMP-30/gluconolactonase/LRE family protein [Rhodoglobus sp.]
MDVTGAPARLTGSWMGHGEGPVWDSRRNRLLCVDLLAGDVLEFTEDDQQPLRYHLGSVAAALRPREKGGYVVAIENGFVLTDDDFATREALEPVFVDPLLRMNDGGCDPQGRFYCGTMAYDERAGAGSLYRLDPDLSVHTVLEGVTISNGLQWSSSGSEVFYVDTPTDSIDVFDFDGATGEFHDRRVFASIAAAAGHPDGVAIDVEGGLWVALWGGGQVHRYDRDGRLSEVVTLPVTNVTACAFGGADSRTLYITTSRMGLGPDDEPEAGSIFTVDAGVSGGVVYAFGG